MPHTKKAMPCAPAAALSVTEDDRREVLQIVGLRSVPQSVAFCVRVVLGAPERIGNKVLARQLETSLATVLMWRGRFQSDGVPGILEDRPRCGRPQEITPEQERRWLKGRSIAPRTTLPAGQGNRAERGREEPD